MGLGRFIKHVLVPGTITMDFVKNMIDCQTAHCGRC